jgi:hypothetical protein
MADKEEKSADLQKWLRIISDYERDFKEWQGRVELILQRYKGGKRTTTDNPANFNILWSNVQTSIPATFSRLPKPSVSRRFRDNDPVGRVASTLVERGLEYEIDHYPDFRSAMGNSVFDRFLGGRGTSWIRYEPHFRAAEEGTPEDGYQITEDADEAEETPEAEEVIDYECTPVDYVHWKDFGHTIARTWEEVTAVWRCVYMERSALVERFGEEIGSKIPLDTRPENNYETTQNESQSEAYQALIYEIWDKSSNTAIWLSKSMNKILDARLDPLKLECFFPCPRPLYATLTTDSLVPEPDFALYQDQARELDTLAARIERLIDALQVKGVYDASVPALARLFQEAPNTGLIAVQNWAAFSDKNGLKGAIDIVDIAPIAQALVACYDATDRVKAQIYEITGLADIIRGSSDPRETATAVQAKGQFGSMRLRSMQNAVVMFATEILQIKAQVMCNEYSDDTWVQISAAMQLSPQDQALIPQALQLIKSGVLRNFRIEVSSDSMIQMDEAQEKQDRMEFMKVAGTYLQGLIQMSHESPKLVPLGVDMLKFGVGGFKVGKQLEGAIDQMADEMRAEIKKKEESPQPPPTPPEIQVEEMRLKADAQKTQAMQQFEMQKMQAQAQIEAQSKQGEFQLEQQRMQMNAQFEQMKMQAARDKEMAQMQADQSVAQAQMQADMQIEQNKSELAAQLEQVKAQYQAEIERARQEFDAQVEMVKNDKDIIIAQMNNAAKVQVAQVGKMGGVLSGEQAQAARDGSDDKYVD